MALSMLTVAARPADEDHSYGHSKAEYFSSGVEGTLILIAALSIAVAAVRRLLAPQPLEQVGIGLAVSAAASVINLAVAIDPAARREAAPLDHARSERAAPVHRRVDVGRRHRRRRGRGRDRLAAPRPDRRAARGRQHRLDRHADRAPIDPRPDGHGAARRRTGGGEGGARQPPERRRRVSRAADAAVGSAALRVAPRPRAGRVDGAPRARTARGRRSEDSGGRAERDRVHAPRVARRPVVVGRPAPGPKRAAGRRARPSREGGGDDAEGGRRPVDASADARARAGSSGRRGRAPGRGPDRPVLPGGGLVRRRHGAGADALADRAGFGGARGGRTSRPSSRSASTPSARGSSGAPAEATGGRVPLRPARAPAEAGRGSRPEGDRAGLRRLRAGVGGPEVPRRPVRVAGRHRDPVAGGAGVLLRSPGRAPGRAPVLRGGGAPRVGEPGVPRVRPVERAGGDELGAAGLRAERAVLLLPAQHRAVPRVAAREARQPGAPQRGVVPDLLRAGTRWSRRGSAPS